MGIPAKENQFDSWTNAQKAIYNRQKGLRTTIKKLCEDRDKASRELDTVISMCEHARPYYDSDTGLNTCSVCGHIIEDE